MPEVHIVGELLGAANFNLPNLFCRWTISPGGEWSMLAGEERGQTQVDVGDGSGYTVWSHPVDVHYSTVAVKGWPRFFFEVWHEDRYGRNELAGYGTCFVPTTPGEHNVECATWRPEGSAWDKLSSFFLGNKPRLERPSLVTTSEDRFDLFAETAGRVFMRINVVTRGFENRGVRQWPRQQR